MVTKITILLWILFFCKFSHVLGPRTCKLNLDSVCSDSEYCDEPTKECVCRKGFERFNNTFCIRRNNDGQTTPKHSSLVENEDNGSVTAYILTPLLLIVLVICGIYINRKYRLVAWFRNKMHPTNENYDEFMIGQDLDDDDDPPLH